MAWLLALFLFFTPALAADEPPSNIVSGAGSGSDTNPHTIITFSAGWIQTLRIYVRSANCARTDGGTSAIFVTFNDSQSTVMVLPNNGGGGGNNMVFETPLIVPVATSFTFTASSGVSTVYCNAQGYTAN